MNTRPSTPQVLLDIIEELNRHVMPLMPGSTDQVRIVMITSVLGQCAARADQEIALMREESLAYLGFAQAVADATDDASVRTAVENATLSTDLRLAAMTAEYSRASSAFTVALDVAMDAGLANLVAEGEDLLRDRIRTEQALTSLSTAGR